MAWIESHQALGRHPKMIRLAARVRACRPQVIGHLHYLWWWALDFAPTGDLSGLTSLEVAAASEWNGDADLWLAALKECRWIDDSDQLHDWHDYAGKLILEREAARERMRTLRKGSPNVRARSPNVPTTVPNPTVPNPTKIAEGVAVGDLRAREAQVAPASPTPTGSVESGQGPPKLTNKPTPEQALAHHGKHWAASEAAYTEDELREAFRQLEAGCDIQGFWMWGKRRAGDWRAALEQRMADNRKGLKEPSASVQAVLDSQELPRVEKRIAEILNSYEGHQAPSEKHRAELKQLRTRREELKSKLGFQA